MVGRVVRAVQWRTQAPFVALFTALSRPTNAGQAQIVLLLAYAVGFVLRWGLAWLILATFVPDDWLPGASAVTTAAEVLPALMVSVFVFVLGSLFVVTQLATTIHSNRASLLLLYDQPAQQQVVRPLLIAVSTLVLALLVPEQDVCPSISAFALVLIAATGLTLFSAAGMLPSFISRVTAPRNFVLWLGEPVQMYLTIGATDAVVWRVGALGEMLRRGVRNGDSLQLRAALGGFQDFHSAYLAAATVNPNARTHQYEHGPVIGWFADEAVRDLLSAGQDAIALDIANADANAIANTLTGIGGHSAEAGHREEFLRAVDGLGELATCTQQMKAPGLANQLAEPIYGLAVLVSDATKHLDDDAAAVALATWALSVAYAMRHLGGVYTAPRHSQWPNSLVRIGRVAPFAKAHNLVDSARFQRSWANKVPSITAELDFSTVPPTQVKPGGLAAIHDCLDDAQSEAP